VNVSEALATRMSCRAFLPTPVPEATVRAILDGSTFALLGVTRTDDPDADGLSLEPAAVMATLLAGISRSLPHLPAVAADGTRVPQPA